MDEEELIELLLDLRHDLGKHMLLPVSMLPADARPAEVRDGLRHALLETRPAPNGHRAARQLWLGFCEGLGQEDLALVSEIARRVERALAWEAQLQASASAPIDRAALQSDLRAVGEAISLAIGGLRGDS